MTITLEGQIGSRTFLECVQRVLLDIGDAYAIGTLANAHSRTQKAMQAVNDALDVCFMTALWPWRQKHAEIQVVAQQMWYDLPDDFGQIHVGPRRNAQVLPLPFQPIAQLYEQHPEIRATPSGTTVSTTTVTEHAGATYFGTPDRFTISGNQIGLFPVPDADLVDEYPTWLYSYYRVNPAMYGDSDVLDLPRYLWMAHHRIALGLTRESMEFSDGQNTYFEGMNQLRNQVALHGLLDPGHEGTVGGINYNE